MSVDAVRQGIIDSLFSPESGGVAEKLLIHLKVFEDVKQASTGAKGGDTKTPQIIGKPRYLCLTQKRNKIRVYKVKRNQSGIFSIGKTWMLEDIRQIEIVDANQFSVVLNKTYLWAVERPRDKFVFIAHVVDACQRFIGKVPKLVKVDESYLLRYLTNTAMSPVSEPSLNASSALPTQLSSSSVSSLVEEPPLQHSPTRAVSPPPSRSHGAAIPSITSARNVHPTSPPVGRASDRYISEKPSNSTSPPHVQTEYLEKQHFPSQPVIDQKEKEREERRERERMREIRRERERREKKAEEEKEKLRKVAEMQDKMAEEASLMNVEELLTDFNWKTSGNAAALEKRLLGELHALEAANVHAIIQSDERVRSVVEQIDKALEELENMESWLLLYSAELNSMGDDIREIETQNRGLQILAQNQHALINELGHLLNAISVPRSCLDSLKYDPMDTVDDIEHLQKQAERLQKVLKSKLGGGLESMKAVQERLQLYNAHSNSFSSRIFEHFKTQIENEARAHRDFRVSNASTKKPSMPTAIPHTSVEDHLIRYQGFSLWEKEMDPRLYGELQRHYAQTMAPLYEYDIRDLADTVRPLYTTLRNRGADEFEYIFKNEDSRPVRALAYGATLRHDESRTHRYRQMLRGSVEGVMGGSGRGSFDDDEKAADDSFAQMMAQSMMLVSREQNFMCDLFQYSPNAPKSFLDRGPVYPKVPDRNALTSRREKIRDVKMSKKILDWMEIMFETLEPSIVSLVEYGVKADPTQVVGMLAAVEFHSEKWNGSDQEFLLRLCNSLIQRLRRMFDRFIADQIKIIEDTKVTAKKRKGILSFFRTFPLFALRLEVATANVEADSQTRKIVDEAYEKIINAMMTSLESIARETDQTGDDKEQLNANIMQIENMHHFYHELRANKLHVLDKWIKLAKSQYDSNLHAYIKVVIRRPLGKLLEFFEGVENLMRTSTPEEVQFHMNYNKARLRKVVAMYPAKEVEKSLEQLYRRVDKHFSEESGLLQVVWRGIQEEFIQQHEKMEKLIQKCYPDAKLHLEFTIDDLLNMMSELARKVH
ncbi:hypothetical protein VTP01DRAFT_6352, partial [Rhizomucor pusillus]|uniref:uncharacterized protein n=1 Tax=Rhizomucor pusillus TaxID=4840 RepID=UPI0037436964